MVLFHSAVIVIKISWICIWYFLLCNKLNVVVHVLSQLPIFSLCWTGYCHVCKFSRRVGYSW